MPIPVVDAWMHGHHAHPPYSKTSVHVYRYLYKNPTCEPHTHSSMSCHVMLLICKTSTAYPQPELKKSSCYCPVVCGYVVLDPSLLPVIPSNCILYSIILHYVVPVRLMRSPECDASAVTRRWCGAPESTITCPQPCP